MALQIALGLPVGFLFGIILQRGRFCMNSAFRAVRFAGDATLLRAYLLAVAVQAVLIHLGASLGLLEMWRVPFYWRAAVVGGLVFGIGMTLAGGCSSGTWSRVGEGMVSSFVALLGFGLAAAATVWGVLRPVRLWVRGGDGVGDRDWRPGPHPGEPPGRPSVGHRGRGRGRGSCLGHSEPPRGPALRLGLDEDRPPPRPAGGAGVVPVRSHRPALRPVDHRSHGPHGEVRDGGGRLGDQLGGLHGPGDAVRVVRRGAPFGELSWRAPPPQRMAGQFGGGLLMGFGAVTAGGCNIGHGLTGVSALALSSVVSTVFTILGVWAGTYWFFQRRLRSG